MLRRHPLLRAAQAGYGFFYMAREYVCRRALPVERDFGGHLALGTNTAERHARRLQRIADRVHHRGRFIAAVHHAIRTFFIISGPVSVPVGFFHQLLEGFRVAFAEEITGPLPSEIISRRIAPWCAAVGLIAGEKIEEQNRLIE